MKIYMQYKTSIFVWVYSNCHAMYTSVNALIEPI